MNFLSMDIGSTGIKCQLFNEKGEILEYIFGEYSLKNEEGATYVDIFAIENNFKALIKAVALKHQIDSIAISTFGESFVLLDENDNVLFLPMIYTDPRGEGEAKAVINTIGEEEIFAVTGTVPQSMFSVYKLLYIKNNAPEIYGKAKKAMLICDYLGYLLTGRAVIDYSLAARTGVFDIKNKCFSQELLDKMGVKNMFSAPMLAGSIVGELRAEIKAELNINNNCRLVLGSHDQVCTSIGAGVLQAGDAVDGMGTVECITTLFDKPTESIELGRMGYPVIPYAIDGIYCTYILNYSCGSSVNFIRKTVMHNYNGDKADFFKYIEAGMKEGPTGTLFLPYLGGAATPYNDINAKGAIVGVTLDTTDSDLYKSVLEGTAMEMKLNAETVKPYGIIIKRLTATGGGSNSKLWLQLKADIQNVPIKALRSGEGGLCGCAMIQAVAMGTCKDLFEARDIFVRYEKEFTPKDSACYDEQYSKYKKLYFTVKELF